MGQHGQCRPLVRGAALALLLTPLVLAAPAADAACRLALALGFDVSKSVSTHDYAVQREGVVAALADPSVRDAFLKSGDKVALAIFEWSGRSYQDILLDWTQIKDDADLDRVSGLIQTRLRDPTPRPTALGHALEFAAVLLEDAPDCAARTLDISGDGRNNDGLPPRAAYENLDFTGITVNGLAIGGIDADILPYFHTELIHGPGAFVIHARNRNEFPTAFRIKLLRELSSTLLGQSGPTAPAG